MRSSFALFDREFDFSFAEAATGGDGGESIRSAWEGIQELQSPQELRDAVTEYMGTFKARAVAADLPELSSFHILVPTEYAGLPPLLQDMHSGCISSADKNLVALSVGCGPGASVMEIGGYMIYDAGKDSLSVVPKLLDNHFHAAIGCQSAVVMCNGDDGGYFLAELVRLRWEFCQAAIWLWKSSAPESGWSLKSARVCLPPGFCSNLCFSYRGSILCWVDLLEGMVMCDLGKDCSNSDCPKLRFIQLPKDCPSYDRADTWNRYHLCLEKCRTMACVGDTIKFVCMDGNVEQVPGQGFDLTVYALSPDLSEWTIDRKYNVRNIWANEAYHSTGMPKLAPSYPVLSIKEDGIIYLVFTHLRVMDDTSHGTRRRQVHCNSQYMSRVDMKNNKVQLCPQSTESIFCSQFLASEISVYQKRLQDHPREIEASEMVASGKRMKL